MQYEKSIYRSFARKMRFLAFIIGAIIALTMPITFFVFDSIDQKTTANNLSNMITEKIVHTIKTNPKLWKYSVVKLTQSFDELERDDIKRIRIFDNEGTVLYDETYIDKLTFSMKGSSWIRYNNQNFGYVEVWNTANQTIFWSSLLFVTFSLIAAGVAFVLFRYPANIIKKAEVNIYKNMDRLNQLSYYDTVTSLRNRTYLYEAYSEFKQGTKPFTLLFLDLDNFKTINDTYGHDTGDLLLRAVAERLKEIFPLNDLIVRIGGDEFAILLTDIYDHKMIENILHKMVDAFRSVMIVNGMEMFITVSIGVVLYPDDGDNLKKLLKNADLAMYSAKKQGRDKFCFFHNQMSSEMEKRLSLENRVRKALMRNEFILYFQPKCNLKTGDIIGCEILIRWDEPGRGIVTPGEFIPLAEETGLIIEIGKWVIQEAFRQIKEWYEQYHILLRFSINISPRQFQEANLIPFLKEQLQKYDLNPNYIELEITENVAMNNTELTYIKLQELKAIGFEISIDDFGTGYSSMAYLKKFPIDTLKIAMEFVRGIESNEEDLAIVSSIVSLGHNLGMEVIAEGIESLNQYHALCNVDCDLGQGFYLSRPIPPNDFIKFLEEKEQQKP